MQEVLITPEVCRHLSTHFCMQEFALETDRQLA